MLLVLIEKKQKVKSIEFENNMRVAHVYAREVSRGNEKAHGVEILPFFGTIMLLQVALGQGVKNVCPDFLSL